ncbi:PREDICTED: uncharacterized protein LOC109580577 [Amphimedon queenslandica]|uniref:Uncharacterized protein n=1 Tax=Amphimedon queenslandica TaxID=400682 RepID=A0A1X7VD64_AMPQE|nr:PREDICTED: uncharacterized protein LOC109580577 [Amphimedon queenslandica]|eukprot:XP_019849456.1 PREDICTED: uncharacterized protein LOC109580577 [Amphimedon queenslandica]
MKGLEKGASALNCLKKLSFMRYLLIGIKLFALAISLILIIASLGVFAEKNKEFYDKFKSLGDYCILFASIQNERILSNNSNCNFVIGGQTISAALIIGSIVIVILGAIVNAKKIVFNIFLLIISSLALIMSLSAAIVISAGLKKTCNSIEEGSLGTIKCSKAEVHIPIINFNVTFYDSIQASMILGWTGVVFLLVYITAEIISLISNCCFQKSKYNILG